MAQAAIEVVIRRIEELKREAAVLTHYVEEGGDWVSGKAHEAEAFLKAAYAHAMDINRPLPVNPVPFTVENTISASDIGFPQDSTVETKPAETPNE